MRHTNFKIIVEGKELNYPYLRLVVFFLCAVGIGVVLAGGGV